MTKNYLLYFIHWKMKFNNWFIIFSTDFCVYLRSSNHAVTGSMCHVICHMPFFRWSLGKWKVKYMELLLNYFAVVNYLPKSSIHIYLILLILQFIFFLSKINLTNILFIILRFIFYIMFDYISISLLIQYLYTECI